jgi:hypothetical protein
MLTDAARAAFIEQVRVCFINVDAPLRADKQSSVIGIGLGNVVNANGPNQILGIK